MKKSIAIIAVIIFILLVCGIFHCVGNAYDLTAKYTDAFIGEILYSDIHGFDGINTLFTGLAFLAAACTFILQTANLFTLEQSNKLTLLRHEYGIIVQDIVALRSTLSSLNEVYLKSQEHEEYDKKDPNLAGCFSTKIYFDIIGDWEEFKAIYNDDADVGEKKRLTNWLQNQINYHTQSFAQIIYMLRSIFSRIDNSESLNNKDKLTLKDSLFFSMSHVDYKVLQLVYLRGSMWKDYGKNDYFSQVFSDDMGRLIIAQSTETVYEQADQFIYNALKAADHKLPEA